MAGPPSRQRTEDPLVFLCYKIRNQMTKISLYRFIETCGAEKLKLNLVTPI